MESNQHLTIESSCYSHRLSFDAESFIEFDPNLISMRWTNKAQEGQAALPYSSSSFSDFESLLHASISLDSSKSLLSRSYRHQSRYFYAVPSIPVALNSPRNMKDGVVLSKPDNFRLSFQKFLWFALMKTLKRMRGLKLARKKEGKAFVKESCKGKRVSDADTESSIHDAVLHCKISNLSSLMEEECKA